MFLLGELLVRKELVSQEAVNEAARRLAICARSVERLVCSGELPRVRVTRRAVRFRVADIESYILERMGTTVTA